MFKYRFILLFAGLLISSSASAATLCVKTKIPVWSDGTVSMANRFKYVSGSSCPSGYSRVVDSTKFKGDKGDKGDKGATGAQGAVGPQGVKGDRGPGINVAQCKTEYKTFASCPEGAVCSNQIACGMEGLTGGSSVGDVMMQWGYSLEDNGAAYLISSLKMLYGSNKYPAGVAVDSTSETGYGAHTPSLQITCCPAVQ